MQRQDVKLVLDVGANTGQYGAMLREELGYDGVIVSFEPLNDAFSALQETAASDPLWRCANFALGDANGAATIHVSANSHSSSLLHATERALAIEPTIAPTRTQSVEVRRLDVILDDYARADDRIFLKIDAQGYESRILAGAEGVLDRLPLVQLEVSFIQTYRDAMKAGEMIEFMDRLGYRIVSITPGWENGSTGELLEADFLFART